MPDLLGEGEGSVFTGRVQGERGSVYPKSASLSCCRISPLLGDGLSASSNSGYCLVYIFSRPGLLISTSTSPARNSSRWADGSEAQCKNSKNA